MENKIKYLSMILGLVGTLYGVFIWIQNSGAEKAQFEGRLYKNEDQRIKEEQHLEAAETQLKIRLKFENHVDELSHEIIELAKEIREDRKRDSILRMKDAITNYQAKKNSDTLVKFWKEYNSGVNN